MLEKVVLYVYNPIFCAKLFIHSFPSDILRPIDVVTYVYS